MDHVTVVAAAIAAVATIVTGLVTWAGHRDSTRLDVLDRTVQALMRRVEHLESTLTEAEERLDKERAHKIAALKYAESLYVWGYAVVEKFGLKPKGVAVPEPPDELSDIM